MEAVLLDMPGCSSVLTDTEPNAGRRDDKIRIGRVRAHLVDVSVDIDRRLPSRTPVRRACDAPNVNVREEHPRIRRGCYRANPEWWSDALAVDDWQSPDTMCLDPRQTRSCEVVRCCHLRSRAGHAHRLSRRRSRRRPARSTPVETRSSRASATRRRKCVGEVSVQRQWREPRRARQTQAR